MISAAPQPDHTLVVLSGVVALVAVFVNPVWAVSGHVYTAAHEGGHALTALIVGRKLTGIRMHADRSGVTHSAGPDRGAGLVVTAAAGYLMPSLIGLAGAALLNSGHDPRSLLLVGLLALTGMSLMIRNVLGGLVLLLFGGLLLLASYRAGANLQAAAAYTLTWFLLFSGVRGSFQLFRGFSHDSDPAHLSRMTFLPAVIWVLLFAAASTAALLIGGRWMLT